MTDKPGADDSPAARLFRRADAHERSLPVAQMTDGRHSVRLVAPSKVCAGRTIQLFEKEPETIRWIAGFPEGAVLFDVGANIGSYTLWAGVSRNARVYAFEPEAANYAVLNSNLRLNGLTERCLAYCVGLSDRNGFDRLGLARNIVGHSGHQVGKRGPEGMFQGIVTVTLDHLVYEAGLPCPSYLKIDVDGLEPAIVRGADRLLADRRLNSVLIELSVNKPQHLAVVDRMEELGFVTDQALLKAAHEKTDGVKYTGNVIFTRD